MPQPAGISTPLKLGLAATLLLVVAVIGVCADMPSKMTHAIVQMSGTDISADSFSAKPKVFWRASNQYCRDEEPDPEKGIHERLVVNEPDAWLINLADNTAMHVVDRGQPLIAGCRFSQWMKSWQRARSVSWK